MLKSLLDTYKCINRNNRAKTLIINALIQIIPRQYLLKYLFLQIFQHKNEHYLALFLKYIRLIIF